jgi:hypothetical protein
MESEGSKNMQPRATQKEEAGTSPAPKQARVSIAETREEYATSWPFFSTNGTGEGQRLFSWGRIWGYNRLTRREVQHRTEKQNLPGFDFLPCFWKPIRQPFKEGGTKRHEEKQQKSILRFTDMPVLRGALDRMGTG